MGTFITKGVKGITRLWRFSWRIASHSSSNWWIRKPRAMPWKCIRSNHLYACVTKASSTLFPSPPSYDIFFNVLQRKCHVLTLVVKASKCCLCFTVMCFIVVFCGLSFACIACYYFKHLSSIGLVKLWLPFSLPSLGSQILSFAARYKHVLRLMTWWSKLHILIWEWKSTW